MAFDGPSFIRHVAERLILEFHFSQGAGSPGMIGAAKEHPARAQLEQLMPGNIRVGSGFVVDSFGGVSRQQDIIIYEDLCPVFTHSETAEASYYPVEGVIAAGEVKSGLGKAELSDAVMKSVSVKALRRRSEKSDDGLGLPPSAPYRPYGEGTCFSGTPAEEFDQDNKSLHQVYTFVLCQRFVSSGQATLENFAEECRTNGAALMPNMVTSLADGSLYPFNSRTHSVTFGLRDGDGAIFSRNAIEGFADLLDRLRTYVLDGRTVDRKHYQLYFRPIGAGRPSLTIDGRVKL